MQNLRPNDFVARIGGEEFAANLPSVSAAGAFELSNRIRHAVEAAEIAGDGWRFKITVSAGIVHSSDGSGSLEDLMKKADAGLYRAKSGGRNRIEQPVA